MELVPDRHDRALRRRFPRREESLDVVSIGAGVIVTATPKWMRWVTGLFRNVKPDEAFGMELLGECATRARGHAHRLNGPQLFHVTSVQDWRPAREIPAQYRIEVGGKELLRSLDQSNFSHARIDPRQGRDVPVAALAMHREEVVGVATFSTNSESL